MKQWRKARWWWRYAVAVGAVTVALLCSLALKQVIVANPFLLFFAAITVSAWYGGLRPGLLAMVLSLLLANFFLIVPFQALTLDPNTLLRIFFFVLVATLISVLSEQRKKSQELLQVTLASIGDAVITTNLSGAVSFINSAAETLTGWSGAEAYGQHIGEIFPLLNETTREFVENPVGTVLETGAVVGLANHTLLLARDGTEIPITDSAAPIRDGAGRVYGVVIVFRDARQQHRSEELRARLSAIVESSQDAILGKSLDGIIETWNAAAEQLYGYTPAEVIGQHVSILAPPERHSEIEQIMGRLRQGEQLPSFETVRVDKQGKRLDVSLTISPIRDREGRLLGASTIARDITQQARAARQQRFLSEASLLLASSLDEQATLTMLAELAIPHLGDWCRIDLLGGDGQLHEVAIVHADPQKRELARELERRYPPKPDAPQGRHQVARSGRPEFYPQVDEALLATAAQEEEHLRLIRELGVHSLMMVPLKSTQQTLGVITFVTSESVHQYTQHDFEIAQELARRAAIAVENAQLYQRTQEAVHLRDQFLALAAHELKTPTTTILGSAQLMQRYIERSEQSSERDRARVRTLVDQVQRLYRLIGLLLDLSRIQEGRLAIEREPVDLCAIGGQIVDEVQPTLRGHELKLSTTTEECVVLGDRLRLEQVFQNLLQNAVKYSPEGGNVCITLERQDGMIYCSVQDEGMGIPPEAQGKIFDRFYRAPNVNIEQLSGMGIGLYVVKEIVTRHGGTIAVRSQEGQGATFIVGLPAYEERGVRSEE